jgi:hypothetical protein
MTRRKSTLYAAALAGCAVLFASAGCTRGLVVDSDSDDVPDVVERAPEPAPELPTTIPPYPSDSDLLPLSVPPTSTAGVYIDPDSISVGDDGVVRITYVVVSRSGVHNTFYEGFRCKDRVYKTYAWGVGEGPFHPMSDSEWKTIPWQGINRFRDDIRSYYLCNNYGFPRGRKEILRYVRDIAPYDD